MAKNLTRRQELLADMSYNLLHFLIKNKILTEYVTNQLEHGPWLCWNEISPNDSHLIMQSFRWDHTKEGHYFWRQISDKYRIYIESKIYKLKQ